MSNIDLIQVISQYTPLRKQGNEYRGKCPLHTGHSRDSLSVFPDKKRAGELRWCCYGGCGGGGVVTFLMLADGITKAQACKRLGIQTTSDNSYAPVSRPEPKLYAPDPPAPPTDAYQRCANALAEACEATLWTPAGAKALVYLRSRGFTDDTLRAARIGYNLKTVWLDRENWEIEIEQYSDGRPMTRFELPAGIVIPWRADGQLWRLFVRRDKPKEGQAKYHQVKGQDDRGNALYNADALTRGKPAVMVEAALDALTIQQEAGDLVAAVASGTTGARNTRWVMELGKAAPLLLAFDADEAGLKATAYWQDVFRSAVVWRPYMDDPAAMLEIGLDVRGWIKAGLGLAGLNVAPAQLTQPNLTAMRIELSTHTIYDANATIQRLKERTIQNAA
jgi:DNA primase